jgi:hypothetical protein
MDELAQRYWKTLSKMIDKNKTTKELENDRTIKRLRTRSDG